MIARLVVLRPNDVLLPGWVGAKEFGKVQLVWFCVKFVGMVEVVGCRVSLLCTVQLAIC